MRGAMTGTAGQQLLNALAEIGRLRAYIETLEIELGCGPSRALEPKPCPHWPECGCGTQSGPHTCEQEPKP